QQYKYAGNYLDRREALEYFAKNKLSDLSLGLNDKYYGLRLLTLENLEQQNGYTVPSVLKVVEEMAVKDPNKKVQAKAIEILAKMNDTKYLPLFEKYVNDSSYSVAGAALEGLISLNPENALALANKYRNDALGKLGDVVADIILQNATEEDFNFLFNHFKDEALSEEKIESAFKFENYLITFTNPDNVRKGVDEIMKFRAQLSQQDRSGLDPIFKEGFNRISAAQQANGNTELANYINGLLK
ncbi:MAG TPA: HEAT repeat domain-containing protein, partial [Hanamia sp.]|nr:HEAT repeat domain-containing protein [Hanamia sp.]